MPAVPASGISSGATASRRHEVGSGDTAVAVGSGDLPVLATPRLLAWMEEATCGALSARLRRDETTVGTRVKLEHLKASPVGATVEVIAELVHVDGRLLRFQVTAAHPDGLVVAHGEVTRVVVERQRFLSRLWHGPSG